MREKKLIRKKLASRYIQTVGKKWRVRQKGKTEKGGATKDGGRGTKRGEGSLRRRQTKGKKRKNLK